jgi:FdhD protein
LVAPSSLAGTVAKEFDIILIGFLRDGHFNIYHGGERIDRFTSAAAGVRQ